MTDTTCRAGKYDRIAQRILEDVLHRTRWSAPDRDAIAFEIGKAVDRETVKLSRELTWERQKSGLLLRRANAAGIEIDAEPRTKKRRRLKT